MTILGDMRAALKAADRSDDAEWYWLVGGGALRAIHGDEIDVADLDDEPDWDWEP